MNKACSDIRVKLKEEQVQMSHICKPVNWHGREFSKHIIKWPGSWNCEKFCHLGDRLGAREGAADSVRT